MLGCRRRSGYERAPQVGSPSARRRSGALALGLFLWCFTLLAGCSFVDDFDPLREPGLARSTSVIEATAGAGRIESPSYRLSLTVGLPQPMGAVESSHHRLNSGTRAVDFR